MQLYQQCKRYLWMAPKRSKRKGLVFKLTQALSQEFEFAKYFRRPKADFGDEHFRIVITAPDKDMALQEDDIAFMLVQV